MPKYPLVGTVVPTIISPLWMPPYDQARFCISATTNVAWPTANMAFFFPVVLAHRITVTRGWWVNSGTLGSNVDVGIYDQEGNRLVSSGSTAQSGANFSQSATVSASIPAGLVYFAMAVNNTTGTFTMIS